MALNDPLKDQIGTLVRANCDGVPASLLVNCVSASSYRWNGSCCILIRSYSFLCGDYFILLSDDRGQNSICWLHWQDNVDVAVYVTILIKPAPLHLCVYQNSCTFLCQNIVGHEWYFVWGVKISTNSLWSTVYRLFRVIHVPVFLRSFASDRSHMKDPMGNWIALPPTYEPVVAEGIRCLNHLVTIHCTVLFS
jgi:hypothetical protein